MQPENQVKEAKKALLVGVYLSGKEKEACEESLGELERLCHTFGLAVVMHHACSIKKIDAGTLLGSGKSRSGVLAMASP